MARGKITSIIGIIFGLLFVGLGVFAIVFVLGNTPQDEGGGQQDGNVPEELVAKVFPEYSWEELSQIAELMESAPDIESARAIASSYGLIDENGNLTTQTHRLELANGITADVRLVGVMHDVRSDGGGLAALTFMASPIDMRRYNSTATSDGGWAGSELRAWLSQDGLALFPDELASRIVTVRKSANKVGKTDDVTSVGTVDDALWLFSCREVCGPITWLADEFDYYAEDNDAILNAEGQQYEAFIREGIDQYSDSAEYLIMYCEGKAVPWWYRTPYAFQYLVETDDTIYQVTTTGYASSANLANDQAGIVVGFCL